MNRDFSSSALRAAPPVVLIIDDQERNLKLLQIILVHNGFEVVTASSGAQAMQRLEVIAPDVILLDVMMPDQDGFETCRKIKERKSSHDIPVIFLSAAADHQSIVEAFSCGGVDYITKPFNKSELLARIRTQIELRRSRQQHLIHAAERERTLDLIGQDWRKSVEVIATLAARLEDPALNANDWTTKGLFSAIKTHSERMLGSIDDFLSRHVEDEDEAEPVFTTDTLKEIASAWYVTARRKQIEFNLSAPPQAVELAVDQASANQIIDALLSNAVNLCSFEGRIFVRITMDDDQVKFSVEDDGPGFPSDYFRRQFLPYPRKIDADAQPPTADSTTKERRFGYGLAIAKRAADRCGATITICNQQNGGAQACVSFPTKTKVVKSREPQPDESDLMD